MCVGWSLWSSQSRRRRSIWARASRTSRRRRTSMPRSAASPSRITCSTNTRARLCATSHSARLCHLPPPPLYTLHLRSLFAIFHLLIACQVRVGLYSCACVRCRATSASWRPSRRYTRSVWAIRLTRSQRCSSPSAGTARSTISLRRSSTRATRYTYI